MNIQSIVFLAFSFLVFNSCQENIPELESEEANYEIQNRTDCCGESGFDIEIIESFIEDGITCCIYRVTYTNDMFSGCKHGILVPSGELTYPIPPYDAVRVAPGQTYIFNYKVCASDTEVQLSSFFEGDNAEMHECASTTLSPDCGSIDCCANSQFTITSMQSVLGGDTREACCRYGLKYENGSDCDHQIDTPAGTLFGVIPPGGETTLFVDVCTDKGKVGTALVVAYFGDDPALNTCASLELTSDCVLPPPPDCCENAFFAPLTPNQPRLNLEQSNGTTICCDFRVRYNNGSDCTHVITNPDNEVVETVAAGTNSVFIYTICTPGIMPENLAEVLSAYPQGEEVACDDILLVPDCECPLTYNQGYAVGCDEAQTEFEQTGICNPNGDGANVYEQTIEDFAACPDYVAGFIAGWAFACQNSDADCSGDPEEELCGGQPMPAGEENCDCINETWECG